MAHCSRYRVDTLPAVLRPPLSLYGYGLGLLLFAYYLLQRLTIRVVVEGHQQLRPSNYVFCHWHGSTPLSLQCGVPRLPSFMRTRPHAWMQHPLWYMKPIHVFLRLMGVKKLVLGSTGHGGREAADVLAEYLRAGYSTVLLPDGPAGPARVLKRGILHVALASNVPIVPLRVTASRAFVAGTWDRKEYPLPFTRLRIQVGDPIAVADVGILQAERDLRVALG